MQTVYQYDDLQQLNETDFSSSNASLFSETNTYTTNISSTNTTNNNEKLKNSSLYPHYHRTSTSRSSYLNNRKHPHHHRTSSSSYLTGCTQHTEACSDHAHYDDTLNARVNTPPCCKHHMLQVYKDFTTALRRLECYFYQLH